jgi:hypothetical protein
MKRFVSIILILVLLVCTAGCSQIRVPKNELAVVTYYEDNQRTTETSNRTISTEASESLRQILKNAKYNAGIGGCAYGKWTLAFGDQVFAFADDGCLTIMDVGNEKYYEVSQEDWQTIMSLITQ